MSEKRDNVGYVAIRRPSTPIPDDMKLFGPPPSYYYAAENRSEQHIPTYSLNERVNSRTIPEDPYRDQVPENQSYHYPDPQTPPDRLTYTPGFVRSNECQDHMPSGSQRYTPLNTQRVVSTDGQRYMANERRYNPRDVVVVEQRSQSRGRLGSRIDGVRDKRQLRRDYRGVRRDVRDARREDRRGGGGPVSKIIGMFSQLLK